MERPVAARASAPSSEPSIALKSRSSLPMKLETLLMSSAATGDFIHVWHCSHRPKHRLRPGPAAHGNSTSWWAVRASIGMGLVAAPIVAPTLPITGRLPLRFGIRSVQYESGIRPRPNLS